MADRDPPVPSAERLLSLRRFVGMEDMDADDAAEFLALTSERVVRAGTRLAQSGSALDRAWLVVEGELAIGPHHQRIGPGQLAGVVEMLSGSAAGLDVECRRDAVVLEIHGEDFFTLLGGNFEMLAGVMAGLSGALIELESFSGAPALTEVQYPPPPLGFVDKLLIFRERSDFLAGGAETVTELAAATTDVTVSGVVERAGQVIERMYVVLAGTLRYGALEVGPGDGFGGVHGLAEVPLAFDVVAAPQTRVLVLSIDAMMDALDDDVPFALSWVRALALAVVGAMGTTGYYPRSG